MAAQHIARLPLLHYTIPQARAYRTSALASTAHLCLAHGHEKRERSIWLLLWVHAPPRQQVGHENGRVQSGAAARQLRQGRGGGRGRR